MTTPDPSSNEVLRLVALLRQIDQLLYKVSQSPTWEQMRPHITELCEGMYDRMRDESDRIRREAYLNAAQTNYSPMTPEQVMSRCYEHGQPDYVLAADTIKALLAAQQLLAPVPEWRFGPTYNMRKKK